MIVLALYSLSLGAQKKFDVYALSVGSAHYSQEFTKFETGFNGFSPLPSATTSARQMQRLFNTFGAAYSDTLLSTPTRFVTQLTVESAINRLIVRVKKDRKPNPLIVFYFCGHGISEGFGWNLFLIPGNFRSRIAGKNAADLSDITIYAGTILDRLESAKLPVLAMLDCCYEGKDEIVRTQDFAYQQSLYKVAELAKDVQGIVRKLNEFAIENPVVFSTTPGQLAKTVNVDINGSRLTVGPLCRRALLTTQSKTLDSFVNHLISPTLAARPDDQALTNWDRDACAFKENNIR